MKYPNFIGGSYTGKNLTVSGERTINWYPHTETSAGATSKRGLLPRPGVTQRLTFDEFPGRALFAEPTNTRGLFAVVKDKLYEITWAGGTSFSKTDRGTVAVPVPNTTPATIASNGDGGGTGGGQLLIGTGGKAYSFVLTGNVLTEEISSGVQMVASIDGYGLYLDATTSTLFQSDLNDFTTWGGSAFQQRSAAADRWSAVGVAGRDVWLHGTETSEVWNNVGTTPFAFAFNTSIGIVPFGIAAAFSRCAIGNAELWLARTKSGLAGVVMATGSDVRIVSPKELTTVIEGFAQISDAVADSYEVNGHLFYRLQFPHASVSRTFVYDLTENEWHECTSSTDPTSITLWRPLYHVYWSGMHLSLDGALDRFYQWSDTYLNDVGGGQTNDILRLRRGPVLVNEGRRLFFPSFTLDMEVAVSDPEGSMTLKFSNNRGKTWASAGSRGTGDLSDGEYGKRLTWNRMGAARGRQYEISTTSAGPWRIADAYMPVRQGTEL